jgi:hypothetical protein
MATFVCEAEVPGLIQEVVLIKQLDVLYTFAVIQIYNCAGVAVAYI